MPAYFLDSSAILKRYVMEPGTAWVKSLFLAASANDLSAASICGAEVVAAITRKMKGGGISATEAARVTRAFRADLPRDFDLIEIDFTLVESAMDLAERHGLRGYDSVQLAAALAVQGTARTVGTIVTLVSSDRELNAAATAEGLKVEDPNSHP